MSHWISTLLRSAATGIPTLTDKAHSNSNLRLLVPASFSPETAADDWHRLTLAAAQAPVTAIFNPADGAGRARKADYAEAISEFREAGGQAIAYLNTQHETRDASAMKAELDNYLHWYEVDGLFFDDCAAYATAEALSYYQDLITYARELNPGLLTIGNPGVPPDEEFADFFDCLVLFEDAAPALRYHAAPVYLGAYPAGHFAMLVHGGSSSVMADLVASAAKRNIGYLYVTDRDFAEAPWLGLPSYWEEQVAAVEALSNTILPRQTTLPDCLDAVIVKAQRWSPALENNERSNATLNLRMTAPRPKNRDQLGALV